MALDNRPLNFDEFLIRIGQTIHASATPGKWEMERAQGLVAEQIIRPTGLLDPEINVRPVSGQVDDLLAQCRAVVGEGGRVLVTTLTKRMAEDLTDYLNSHGVVSRYLHSDIDTMERMAIIQALRRHEFDVLVGINLLREGLDIPEVEMVAILDADKEGFLRSTGSLIQTFGRAARNVRGRVVMYADKITASMRAAMDETSRRRARQTAFNEAHNITPTTILKAINTRFEAIYNAEAPGKKKIRHTSGQSTGQVAEPELAALYNMPPEEIIKLIAKLEKDMTKCARDLEFEKAAELRDQIKDLRARLLLADKV